MCRSMTSLRDKLKVSFASDRVKHVRIPAEDVPCPWIS
jgi:hypothetical protein